MMKLAIVLALVVSVSALPNSRIINGDDATQGSHSHQASLQVRRQGRYSHICGGSLIAPNWVLTAAHCTEGTNVGGMRIVMNEHSLNSNQGNELRFSVARKIEHADYSGTDFTNGAFPNDIALLELSAPAPANMVIDMADDSHGTFAGTQCIISGWGVTETGSLSNILQEVTMDILSNSECANVWGSYIVSGNICIYDSNSASCNGDSGGPMVCDGVLAGVTSWGVSGCQMDGVFYPSVYTRVSEFRDWISSNMA